ncbi:hypothetical protein CYMTET_8725 [Cymbomonas tetramitiformis]|uniref:sphinganine-1-phosphate aldolase n=1 Tax=Cymbomonas tetramitiformis TaxID=36881 RepID=A0AAE0GSY0_9CHLO|nr:hypothetical protein CYMTET_8725 [Cymbomonas tetramitiformis]
MQSAVSSPQPSLVSVVGKLTYTLLRGLERSTFALVFCLVLRTYKFGGLQGVILLFVKALRTVPGVDWLIKVILTKEVKGAVRELSSKGTETSEKKIAISIPEKGLPHSQLLEQLAELKVGETAAEDGKLFALVYSAGDTHTELLNTARSMFKDFDATGSVNHADFLDRVYRMFCHDNALNPNLFASLRKMETETISMAASLMNGPSSVVGSLTSGGTESCLMAMKAYRDRARALCPHITKPEVVACITVHPAFEKAAHYFDLTIVHVPTNEQMELDVSAMEKAITKNTILLIASAPQYPHGIVDPVEQVSELALQAGLPLHVDSCFGGFMLPWVEKLGYYVPKWDFRVKGVTSISADLHKYGYGPKGTSVILYRDTDYRKYQYFAYAQWPGGLFGSPSMAGSRPGGLIAAAWATLMGMGQDGYLKYASETMEVTKKLIQGVRQIEGLKILGDPHMTGFAIAPDCPAVDMYALADEMEKTGWHMERQQYPSCIHFSIMPTHIPTADQLLEDLAKAVSSVKANPDAGKDGSAAMYGMVAKIPDKAIVDDFIVQYFSEIYTMT